MLNSSVTSLKWRFLSIVAAMALTRAYPCTEVSEPEHGEASSFRGQSAVCQKRKKRICLAECLVPCLEVDQVMKIYPVNLSGK